jgi:23S rRNA pseudouridine1911/1915/1917 synthase
MSEPPRHLLVPADLVGHRLDRILADLIPEVSRHRIQRAFAEGEVMVDGRARPKSFRPQAGAEVVLTLPVEPVDTTEAQDIPLEIIHEDDHLLVINKPAGLVVHPAPGHPDGTLVNALLHHGRSLADTGDPGRPGIVHRLDQETSGLLVIARTPVAHRALAAQLKDHTLGREYLTLSWGQWREASGRLEGNLNRHPRDRKRMAVVTQGGRQAVTHYEVIDDLACVQLCRVHLETGRTHQIRVHFQHHGHPVVGDPVYGDDQRALNVAPVDRVAAAALVRAAPRQLLHAAVLRLVHPADGVRVEYRAPLAPDFAAALAELRRNLGRPEVGPEAAL